MIFYSLPHNKEVSAEEAKERRAQLAKLRALESYYAAKCRRVKSIKSKNYHRIKNKVLHWKGEAGVL